MSVVVKGQRATIKVGPWVLGTRILDLHVEASTCSLDLGGIPLVA